MLIFTTPGDFDPQSLTMLGLSAKPNSDSPIGKFGTGLKYAIAGLLRTGRSIVINSDTRSIEFRTVPQVFRGARYNAIEMTIDYHNGDGQVVTLPFTTDLGAHWEPWMWFRELEANTRDEGGTTAEYTGPNQDAPPLRQPGTTEIILANDDLGSLDAHEVFLSSSPIYTGQAMEIHAGTSHWIFHQGIRAMMLDRPSRYTYNITEPQALTEDRTLASNWDTVSLWAGEIRNLDDEALLLSILCCDESDWEWDQDLAFEYKSTSEAFRKVVEELRKSGNGTNRSLETVYREYWTLPVCLALSDPRYATLRARLHLLADAGIPTSPSAENILLSSVEPFSRRSGKRLILPADMSFTALITHVTEHRDLAERLALELAPAVK